MRLAINHNYSSIMKTINDFNFSGQRALIRVDFNVPLDKAFAVTDDNRIRATIPTLKKILADGGSCILMSHLGRPKGGPEDKYSLRHTVGTLESLLGRKVIFGGDCIGEEAAAKAKGLKGGDVLLLENLRFYKEEEKGDLEFARKLSTLGDVYVNDAFGTAHRAHASTTIVAQYFAEAKLFGYLVASELNSLAKVLDRPEKPLCAIVGGAKVSSKIEVLRNLLVKCDELIIGGGMAFTFIKVLGGQVGNSLVEDDHAATARVILAAAKDKGVKLHLPVDAVVADAFADNASTDVCPADAIPAGWMGLDIGPATIKQFNEVIKRSKTILWNGPMGVFEMASFQKGSLAIAQAVAEATANGSFSLVGGGDSVAAVNRFGLADKISYVSTGGGAMLEYLQGKVLPGIAAVQNG